jgi:hypothetical protein
MTSEKVRAGFKMVLLVVAVAGLATGIGLSVTGKVDLARIAWVAGVVPVLAALGVEIVQSFWRGEVGLDVVAALSVSAALVVGEMLAAAVVALMYSGGTFLESFCRRSCPTRDARPSLARSAHRDPPSRWRSRRNPPQ